MENSLKSLAANAIPTVRPFLSSAQLSAIVSLCTGEEGEFFMQKIIDLEKLISTVPVTYEQDGEGDSAIVYLHYFHAGCDWYITEKDIEGEVQQAFGFAILNGDRDNAELGYISIAELVGNGAELDLYFEPCRLAEIKTKLAA
jgi:hypothetical protein